MNKRKKKIPLSLGWLRGKLKNNEFDSLFKSMVALSLGAAGGRIIGVMSIPILSRIYTPAAYGTLSLFVAACAILSPLLSLRYSQAITIERNDSNSINIFFLSVFISVSTAALIFLAAIYFFVFSSIDIPFGISLVDFILILLTCVFVSINESVVGLFARYKNFRIISESFFIQSLFGEAIKISLGILNPGSALGLIVGHSFSIGAGGAYLILIRFRDFVRKLERVNLKKLLILSRKYSDFPKYRLLSHSLVVLSLQMPVVMIGVYYGVEYAGQFGLAYMAISLPANLISENMSVAYYSEISSIGTSNKEKIRSLTSSLLKRLFLISIIPSLLLISMGEYIFKFSFGSDWGGAGLYASIMAFFLPLQFLQKPTAYLFITYRKNKDYLFLNLFRAFLVLGVISLCGHLGADFFNCIIFFSFANVIYYLFSIIISMRYIR